MDAIIFELNKQNFACRLSDISEILMMMTLHSIPQAPDFIEGVFNLRGLMVPVIDLSKRLGYVRNLPPPRINESEETLSHFQNNTRMLIITINELQIGMIIDGIKNVIDIKKESQHQSVVTDNALPDYVNGISIQDQGIIQIVHLKKVLTSEELSVLRNT